MEIIKHPDSTSYVTVENIGRDFKTFKINSYEDLWGAKLADKIDFRGDILAAAKNRKFVDGKSVLTQQLPNFDYKGKDVLIIDDICIYGGTFKGLAKLLRKQGCNKLYLAISHLTIQNHEKDNVFEHFDKVFTTNSKYDDYWVRINRNSAKQIPNLEVIKLF